jgi:cytokinin dehydrogenase
LNLDLTVGGTLAVGGFGSTSHLYGPCVSNVAEARIVTGAGAELVVTPESNRELYDAALAGLGRCAIMASADIVLRPARAHVRTWFLLYEELRGMLEDQRTLAERGSSDHLEGLCSMTMHGLRLTPNGRRPLASWSYCLLVSKEFDADEPDADALLAGLQYKRLLLTERDDSAAFAARYDVRFEAMRVTGASRQPHPWLECVLPYDVAGEIIPRVLTMLPTFLGDLHRVGVIGACDRPRSLVFPDSDRLVSFAILPAGVHPALLGDARKALKAVEGLLLAAGGKRYLSGWLDNWNEEALQAHFGEYFSEWQRCKARFDPRRVLTSALFTAAGCQ